MKLYEIKGFLNKKLQRKRWKTDYYIASVSNTWINSYGNEYQLDPVSLSADDWEEFVEKKTITLYRYTYKLNMNQGIYQTNWNSPDWSYQDISDRSQLLKTETKEIEI